MSDIFKDNQHASEFYENTLPYVLITLSLVALVIFLSVLFLSFKITKKIDVSNYTVDNGSVLYYMDIFRVNSNSAYFEGWVFKQNEDISTVNTYFLLHDTSSDQYIRLTSMTVDRPEVAKILTIGNKIDNCGVKSNLDMDILNKDHIYELCILYGNNDHKIVVKTGKRFKGNGEVINE